MAPLQAQPTARADAVTVSGTAAYRQRIAMPREAVLTVRIESPARADAPAKVLAETREVFGARQVPIPFALTVPRAAIDPQARYGLSATITVDSEVRFTTERPQPVFAAGAADKLDLLLIAAPAVPAAPVAPPPQVGFALPVTVAGVLPCADCRGVAHTLTLRADGQYRLRRTYLGKPGDAIAELGRWTADASGRQVTLGGSASAQRFEVTADGVLRQLDPQGRPIRTQANLDLRRTARVDAVTDTMRWRGEFTYAADAAHFTDCASGLRWPVAMGGDYLAAERSYTRTRSAPGAPLIVNFDGRAETRPAMEGPPREHMVIDRFAGTEAGAGCKRSTASIGATTGSDAAPVAALKDTYWKLVELDGQPVGPPAASQREPRLTLASQSSRAFGFAGCNQFTGAYELDGDKLRFKQMAGTLMACLPAAMALETKMLAALGASTGHRIEGQRLSLTDGEHVRAQFVAVYLR